MFVYLLICMFLHSFHVEHVDKEYVAAEVEDPEEVYPEEQLQEFEAADQAEEQFVEPNLANSDSQPDKHRFI